jgi:ornithine decarboxylase
MSKQIDLSDDPDRPVFLINLDDLSQKMNQWTSLLPRVIPYYAVKSNPDMEILRELAKLGANFDCASAGEIKMVRSLGVSPDRIVFANPMKPPSHLAFAKDHDVNFTVFDSKEEALKISEIHPTSRLLIRIHVDDSFSICPLNGKFGAHIKDVEPLLSFAQQLGLNVVGVSFHVGSGCLSSQSYEKALTLAKSVFNTAEHLGLNFDVLDIGGGFPGTWGQEILSFPTIASIITPLLDRLFPPHITVIAEPGRYFCCSCATLITRVIGKREEILDGTSSFKYYLNDGLYGSLNCILYDHVTPVPCPLKDVSNCQFFKTTIYGPTCDSLDRIVTDYQFPQMSVGDLIYFPNAGAYTKAAGSEFNGFLRPKVHYLRNLEVIAQQN